MIKINMSIGGSFQYPNSLKDITLKTMLDYLTFVEPTKPQELINIEKAYEENDDELLQSALDNITDKVMYKKIYPYMARVVAHFADGIDEKTILGGKKHGDGMNLGQLKYLYDTLLSEFNNVAEPEYNPIIEVDGELWYLPQRYMEKSTLIEYAEASQFEENITEVNNGNLFALAKIMCVLVRKEGEVYSDKLLKREEMFLNWNLEDCYKVAFFLMKRSETSILNFQVYTAAQNLTKLKQESIN